MTYSLLDPNDWEAWQRQQQDSEALGTLLPPDSGLGGPPPMAAYQAPPHAEMAPLQLDTGPDWSDALGVGTTALATLADLGLNHGRGTGQILAAGGQFGQARAEQRLRGTQDALAYEEKRAQLDKSNKYNDYLYANMAQRGQNQSTLAQQRGQNIDLRARDVGVKEANSARAAENQDPTPFIAWAKDRGYDLSGLKTMSQARSAMGPLTKEWDLEHAGEKAQAARTGTIQADLNAAPDTTAVAAGRAAAVQTATQGGKLELVDETARAKAKAEQDVAGDKQIGNADIADQNVWKNVSTKGYNDANDIAMSRAVFKHAMDDMAAIRARSGTQVVPSGDKTAYDSAQSAASSSLSTLFKTGVISEPEYRRYVDRIPNSGMSVGSVWGAATNQDVVGDQISGTRDELLGIFDTGLKQYGLKAKGTAQPSAADQPLPPDRITGPVSGGFDVPGNLGVAGTRRPQSVPDFPGSNGMAGTNPPYVGPTRYSGPPTGSPQHPFPKPGGATQLPRAQPNPDGTFTLPGGLRPYSAQEVQQFIQMGALAPL